MIRSINIMLSLLWVLWGWTFADPSTLVRVYPIDPYQFAFITVVGLVMPCLGCWFYSRKYPTHAPWLRPSLSRPLGAMLKLGQPGWIFVLAYSFFIAGVSCAAFALLRNIPLSGFHLIYLLTGVALMLGAAAALRVFDSEFSRGAGD